MLPDRSDKLLQVYYLKGSPQREQRFWYSGHEVERAALPVFHLAMQRRFPVERYIRGKTSPAVEGDSRISRNYPDCPQALSLSFSFYLLSASCLLPAR